MCAAPHIVWSAIFIVVPLIMVFYYAFTDKSGAFTLDNVTRLTNYTSTFLRSLWFGIVAPIICLLIAYPLAYILSKMKLRAQSTMVMLVMIPMWMNFLLRTYAWMTLLEDSGVINSILAKINIGPFHMINTSGAVILGMVYNFLPYMILPIYSVMTKLDNSLIEAAQDLGANRFHVIKDVIFPSTLSVLHSSFWELMSTQQANRIGKRLIKSSRSRSLSFSHMLWTTFLTRWRAARLQ